MTQSRLMRALALLLLAVAATAPLTAQGDDPVTVSTDHPRLFLRPARLRLLRRERQRASTRWQQFESLVVGQAPMPENAFAQALYYQVTGDAAVGRQAVAWALGGARDLRSLSLVFDWCRDLLSEAQQRDFEQRIATGLAGAPADSSVASVRSRALAAIVLFDHVPQTPQRELERVVRQWWQGNIVPALAAGRGVIARDDAYALFELLHALRDNTTLDLREACPQFFVDYPILHMLSHYPAVYHGAENDFRLVATRRSGELDLQLAALSRAAELAMVAYDANAADSQLLQGWLMHDHFILRGTFGAPYELLWANPYQPGLSYTHTPLVFHDALLGRLLIRSSWEDTAKWFGYYDGLAQVFEDGRATNLDPHKVSPPLAFEEAVVCFGQGAHKFHVTLEEEQPVFLVGLEPRRTYRVEVDDEEMREATADPGGILELAAPYGKEVGVLVKEAGPAVGQAPR